MARVTHACDGVLDGDYLEPYTDPVAPAAILGGEPDYAHPARIVMADEKMQTGAAGTLDADQPRQRSRRARRADA